MNERSSALNFIVWLTTECSINGACRNWSLCRLIIFVYM